MAAVARPLMLLVAVAAVATAASVPDPLDVSLDVLPVGFYGSYWGVRPPELIAKMSKMTLLILMQNDGTCWGKCCPQAETNPVSKCGPLHNASALPGCDPSCDQQLTQMQEFAKIKAAAHSAGRRPPHCQMYMNAVYLWPFDASNAKGHEVQLLDIHGQPHMETADPGLFPSYFWDFSRPSGEAAWLAVVERALAGGAVDGIYADCYYKFPFKCKNLTHPTQNCRAVRNGKQHGAFPGESLNEEVTAATVTSYEAGKTRTMQKVASLLANRSGSFFAVRSSGEKSGAQTSPIFGASPSLFIHIHVDVTNGKTPYYPPGPPAPPAPPAPPTPPPAPPAQCVAELEKVCNTSAGKKPCERCCKHEITRLNKTGVDCTKADRETVCKHPHGPPRPGPPPAPGPGPGASACARDLAARCGNETAKGDKDACEACCKAEIKADKKSLCSNKTAAKDEMKQLCKHPDPDHSPLLPPAPALPPSLPPPSLPPPSLEGEWWRRPVSRWGMAPWEVGAAKGGKLTPPELIAIVNATLPHYRYISVGQNAYGAVKSGYNSSAFESQGGDSGVALFLMAVQPGCVLMCNGWAEEYAQPLGMPTTGGASYDAASWTWRREFASGTVATWCNGTGTIHWAEK